MRKAFEEQRRFGCQAIKDIELNVNCRDEIIPILAALQHIYSEVAVKDQILALVAADVNQDSRDDCGRKGLDYWQILVLWPPCGWGATSITTGCKIWPNNIARCE
jgi:hypothetical protein